MTKRQENLTHNPQFVRVIGDPILHSPGSLFPMDSSKEERAELNRQIEIAKEILIKSNGAGIAANQCAPIETPYQFAIVGIFKEIPAHVQGVARRYPGVLFPEAMIMVNPEMTYCSQETQTFNHACLSVPGPNRCEVCSPEEITVAYLDPRKDLQRVHVTLQGIDAVVLWHEMNHILSGKTYIDTVLASLSPRDVDKFAQMTRAELARRGENKIIAESTTPPFYFTVTVNEQGESQVNDSQFAEVLPKLTTETLNGFLLRCRL